MNSNGTVYKIDMSTITREERDAIFRRARIQGAGASAASAYRTIFRRLQHDPNNLGEPRYELKSLRLTVRHVIVAPLGVEFAVHWDKRVVFIKRFRFLG